MTIFDRVPVLGGLPADVEGWQMRGGLIVPRRTRPVGIDLFCGAGGFSLGFIEAGFEVIAGLDNDPHAALTYMVNLGSHPMNIHFASDDDGTRLEKVIESEMRRKSRTEGSGKPLLAGVRSGTGWIGSQGAGYPPVRHFFFGDARSFTGADILRAVGMRKGEVDCVVGSPPCQGFSRAGRREVMDPRNTLVFEFARLILEISPKTLCMENVPDIVSMVTPEGIPIIDAFCRILQDGGFGTVDGLKRALTRSPKAGAAMLGRPDEGFATKARRKEKPRTEAPAAAKQVSLFE